jgi:hypothetical protein
MNSIKRTKNTFSTLIAVGALAAGFVLSGLPARAQDQPAQNDAAAQSPSPDQQNSADQNNPPAQANNNDNQDPNDNQNPGNNQNQNSDPNAGPPAGPQAAAPQLHPFRRHSRYPPVRWLRCALRIG